MAAPDFAPVRANRVEQIPLCFIYGAGRSGTTMLKEALGSLEHCHACRYELNHLWRYRNDEWPNDCLSPSDATEEVRSYVRRTLQRELLKAEAGLIIEKTVANVVRVGFVYAVFPEGKFIHVRRDGRAVVASAIKRWNSLPKGGYLFSKARTVPLRSLPRAGYDYIKSRFFSRFFHREGRPAYWGPRWKGFSEEIEGKSLPEICALQWVRSLEAALEQQQQIPPSQLLEVRYESLVQNPRDEGKRIKSFLGISEEDCSLEDYLGDNVHVESLEKWKTDLSQEDQERIEPILRPMLKRLGYQ